MTVKKTSKSIEPPKPVNREMMKELTSDSAILAACAAHPYTEKMLSGLEMVDMGDNIRTEINRVNKDDLTGLVGMLVGQAHALQLMFTHLARRANGFEQLKQYQAFMGMALKTQAQSRATIQAIADLKFPRQVIVTKQANISQGHQQVNNGDAPLQTMPAMPATHAGNFQSEQNELLENVSHETQEKQRLDTRTPIKTGANDSQLATVATLNGRKND